MRRDLDAVVGDRLKDTSEDVEWVARGWSEWGWRSCRERSARHRIKAPSWSNSKARHRTGLNYDSIYLCDIERVKGSSLEFSYGKCRKLLILLFKVLAAMEWAPSGFLLLGHRVVVFLPFGRGARPLTHLSIY